MNKIGTVIELREARIMGEKNIAPLWECECSSKNPFRYRKCKNCGRDMPEFFANKIYYEVLKEQKAFIFIEDQGKAKKRYLKFGYFMERARNTVIPIMVVAVVALNAGRIYLDDVNINKCTSENLANWHERLWHELDNTRETMNGLKSTPTVVGTVFSDAISKITDINKGLSVKHGESEKNIEYVKIEKVKNKIERVTEYVTGRFE